MNEVRNFENNFADWTSDIDSSVLESMQVKIRKGAKELLIKLESNYARGYDVRDCSVYTGTSGFALLYYHMSRIDESNKKLLLQKALEHLKYPLQNLKHNCVSFLCGDSGPLAIASVIEHELGNQQNYTAALQKLLEQQYSGDNIPDELLYGRVGYLYSLLFVNSKIENAISREKIVQVVDEVLKSGQTLAKRKKHESPLMYRWHDKYYIGAAHGVAGILYMLMEAKDFMCSSSLHNLVKPSVDYVLSLQFRSGNFPSSLGNSSDKLIHWCHGSPGVIHMFIKAFEVFNDERYLSAAVDASNSIWDRGLLKKGDGICHGVSGNGYAFLRLYQLTKDKEYLYRALKFAEWCLVDKGTDVRTPDRPLSLFEGLAGVIYFLTDVSNPAEAHFPAFQL